MPGRYHNGIATSALLRCSRGRRTFRTSSRVQLGAATPSMHRASTSTHRFSPRFDRRFRDRRFGRSSPALGTLPALGYSRAHLPTAPVVPPCPTRMAVTRRGAPTSSPAESDLLREQPRFPPPRCAAHADAPEELIRTILQLGPAPRTQSAADGRLHPCSWAPPSPRCPYSLLSVTCLPSRHPNERVGVGDKETHWGGDPGWSLMGDSAFWQVTSPATPTWTGFRVAVAACSALMQPWQPDFPLRRRTKCERTVSFPLLRLSWPWPSVDELPTRLRKKKPVRKSCQGPGLCAQGSKQQGTHPGRFPQEGQSRLGLLPFGELVTVLPEAAWFRPRERPEKDREGRNPGRCHQLRPGRGTRQIFQQTQDHYSAPL